MFLHIAGTLLEFVGVLLLASGGTFIRPDSAYLPSNAVAFAAALIWSSYSVASSLLGSIQTDAIGAFSLVAGILSAVANTLFETAALPSTGEWLALTALGLGPSAGAFFLWDWGLKRASVRALGGIAYCAPLSISLLIALGPGSLTIIVAIATVTIVGGAFLAAGDIFRC